MGHLYLCYAEPYTFFLSFLPVLLLAPHFSIVRYLKRIIYKILEYYEKIGILDKAFNETDLEYMKKISNDQKQESSTIEKTYEIYLN